MTINTRYGIYSHSGTGQGNKQARGKFHFQHVSSFCTWLNNPILRGHLCYGRGGKQRQRHKHLWDIRYNVHEEHRLISELEYNRIEGILTFNTKRGGSFKPSVVHPFSGLVVCSECSGKFRVVNMQLRSNPAVKRYYYQCQNWRNRACSQKPSVREDIVEALVIAALTERAEVIAASASIPQDFIEPPELQELRSQLAGLERLGKNPAIETAIEQFKLQITNLQHQLLSTTVIDSSQRELLLQTTSEDNFWSSLTSDEKREYFRALVERVVVRDGAVVEVQTKI